MAYFLDCPGCHQPTPRGAARCPHCDLSAAEALQRSDLPFNERPPLALYEGPVQTLRAGQQFVIGICFFSGTWFALFQHWLASALCFAALWCLTPASAELVADQVFRGRVTAPQIQKLGALLFFSGAGLGLFGF